MTEHHPDLRTGGHRGPAPDTATDDGSLHLAERDALRRVSGLSTELQDITEVEYRQIRLERVVLVGVWTQGTWEDAERSLRELAALAETAGSEVLEGLIQRRKKPDAATYIGSGKAAELRQIVVATDADTVICDGELTPGQLRQLEAIVKVKVVDRTWLILDIFAQHARSKEGKAQVSLAQMEYLLPRLRGWGESLSRQAGGRAGGGTGGVGTRGPGETKLETDRRRIRSQMTRLRRDLAQMATVRETKRAGRRRHETPSVAIAGYTNAGKSSLLNRITGAHVLVEDALFATLDPTVRRVDMPSGRTVTMSDTVGFVRHLPHQLVEAFRSTLEEVGESDVILHVIDGSDESPQDQLSAVRGVLSELGVGDRPEVVVLNKVDIADQEVVRRMQRALPDLVLASARTGEGIDDVLTAIEAALPHPTILIDVLLPYDRGDLLARIHSEGEVDVITHEETGTHVVALVGPELANQVGEVALLPGAASGSPSAGSDQPATDTLTAVATEAGAAADGHG